MIVCPTVTCPSPAMTTWPRWRIARIVVPRVSGPRVCLVIRLHETAEVHVRVALGGGEARMPEQLLDGAQVGSGAEEMGGEGVSQRVRRGLGCGTADQHVTLHQPRHAARREPSAPGVAKHRSASRCLSGLGAAGTIRD